ncbi:MAG: glycosyltransferase family 1 protein, partial [Chrysiogenales bacterium]
LVTVGRLIKRKALDILIRAVAAARAPGVRLYIMGDGPEREFLETTARECGAGDRVVFLGYVTDEQKFGHIAVADLFTLTSLHEGFGIVFMESMYFGLPIVCTNNGGQTDFLRDGENALLVDVGDIDGCAAAIDRFASDRKLYATCSANNREAVKRFYAGAVAARYIDMFRDTAG